MVDAEDRLVKLALTAGQAGDAPTAAQMLPLVAPGATLIADRASDTNAIRYTCLEKKASANIPPRVFRKEAFGSSTWLYRQWSASDTAMPHGTDHVPRAAPGVGYFSSLPTHKQSQQKRKSCELFAGAVAYP